MIQWTPEIVRARFVEACDTARRLPHAGMQNRSGFWPAYVHTYEEQLGWGTQRLAEEREMRFRRKPPSAAAISRHDEVAEWTARLIADESRRQLIWTWAWCRMAAKSFSARCRNKGWVKITAYRRINCVAEQISAHLNNEAVLLRLPDENWLIQESADMACVDGKLADNAQRIAPAATPTFSRSEKPTDMLDTPEAVKQFTAFLKRTNARRRAEQKKRRLLGLEEIAA